MSARDMERVVVCPPGEHFEPQHERACRVKIAEQLALLTGSSFDLRHPYTSRSGFCNRYLVPTDTLVSIQRARELGVRSQHDLFGGVVPYPFVATKVITHALIEERTSAPMGWSHDFPQRVRESVLQGYSAFTLRDAHRAGGMLLKYGAARIKPARGRGGRGQIVFANASQLERALGRLDPTEVEEFGIVLEEELKEVSTYSVGQVHVADLVATYCGTQRLTPNCMGEPVYGGSALLVARGDFEALLRLKLSHTAKLAIAQARAYDTAALELFAGMFASRRNYDVAQGSNAVGSWRSGVLEQSWRIGGASCAEVCALVAFRADPSLFAVHASCYETYGLSEDPPPHAVVYFRGIDEEIGPITKYALVETHAGP